jgi:sRNA-binding protein
LLWFIQRFDIRLIPKADRFPQTFAVSPIKRRPLKVGIFEDIATALDGAMEKKYLSLALKVYTNNPIYRNFSKSAPSASTSLANLAVRDRDRNTDAAEAKGRQTSTQTKGGQTSTKTKGTEGLVGAEAAAER